MAAITAGLVKELREKSGAGMMDCKKALSENDGNLDEAMDWLRKKGIASAAKKSGRIAAEGLVGVASEGATGAVVEINAETDFVARNDQFQGFVSTVTKLALSVDGDLAKLAGADYPGAGKTVSEQLTDMIATIGENMGLRRTASLSVSDGVVSGYVHNATAEGLGKIGVLVALESTGDKSKLDALGRQIAMHVAAAFPLFLTVETVDTTALDKEREVLAEQARASGKPESIIDKMVEGRLRKYYEEVVLLEQIFVVDGENKVGKVVEQAAADVGAPVKLTGFVRYALGEGIEKKEEDFAAEVAAAVKG